MNTQESQESSTYTMYTMVKHYTCYTSATDRPGRVAVAVRDGRFEMADVAGPAPGAWVLSAILADNPDIVTAANRAACFRQYQHAVVQHNGMSGATTFRLIERRYDPTQNYPTVGVLHISMHGKLNDGVKCRLSSLPPLVAAALAARALRAPDGAWIREEALRGDVDWKMLEDQLAVEDGELKAYRESEPLPVLCTG